MSGLEKRESERAQRTSSFVGVFQLSNLLAAVFFGGMSRAIMRALASLGEKRKTGLARKPQCNRSEGKAYIGNEEADEREEVRTDVVPPVLFRRAGSAKTSATLKIKREKRTLKNSLSRSAL
jgi:hypothetical protein